MGIHFTDQETDDCLVKYSTLGTWVLAKQSSFLIPWCGSLSEEAPCHNPVLSTLANGAGMLEPTEPYVL